MRMAWAVALVCLSTMAAAESAVEAALRKPVDISEQPLSSALEALAKARGFQVVYHSDVVSTIKTKGARGELTASEALRVLLEGTGLTYRKLSEDTVTILTLQEAQELEADKGRDARGVQGKDAGASVRVAQNETEDERRSSEQTTNGTEGTENTEDPDSDPTTGEDLGGGRGVEKDGIPEVLVRGSRIINSDARRTEDDVQPYVVFDADAIQSTQASSIEEFLKSRLPMNTQQATNSQALGGTGNTRSQFNLRGLGANQTLILVDGRRMPGAYSRGATAGLTFSQPDINGIPLSMVERIEVLPATASGIYGGGATGGVINIIMKRDYSGTQLSASYGNTFDAKSSYKKFGAATGFAVEGGRTHLMLGASHADSSPLLVGERNFAAKGRERQYANNPTPFFSSPFSIPLGHTTNISSANGSNLILKNSGTSLNSPRTHVPSGYAGTSTDGGAALIANAGRYDLALPDDTAGLRQASIANPTFDAVYVNPRRSFGENIEAFLDLSWNRNRSESVGTAELTGSIVIPAAAPNNPFTSNVRVTFPKPGLSLPSTLGDKTLHGTAGFIFRFPREWSAEVEYGWSRVRTLQETTQIALSASGNAALANGTLDVIRDLNSAPIDFSSYLLPSPNGIDGPTEVTLSSIPLRVSGPLFTLPGGPLTVSGLLEYRKQRAEDSFADLTLSATPQTATVFRPARSQSVRSYALETHVPIVGNRSSMWFVRGLDLQAAVRHDDYETRSVPNAFPLLASRSSPLPSFSITSNEVSAARFTYGLRYAPVADLFLRASHSTGFLAPSIDQIVPNTPGARFTFVLDPKRGGAPFFGNVQVAAGGNSSLGPEDSTSDSIGIVLTPRFAKGLRLSVDYTRIRKADEIFLLTDQQVVDLEDSLPGRVTRGAPLPTDPAGWAGPITGFDITLLNIAATRTNAYDFQFDYSLSAGSVGNFSLYAVATRQNRFARQIAPTSATVDTVGLSDGNLKWRGNLGITWQRASWAAGWNAQFYDSYFVYRSTETAASRATTALSQGDDSIPSQTYHDAYLRYTFGDGNAQGQGLLNDLRVDLAIQNVFEKYPPTLAITSTFGGYSTYGDPRLRRLSIAVTKYF